MNDTSAPIKSYWPVHAGDLIEASVAYSLFVPGALTLALIDFADSHVISQASYQNVGEPLSAECIVERPSIFLTGGFQLLADFGTFKFSQILGGGGCNVTDQNNQNYPLSWGQPTPWNTSNLLMANDHGDILADTGLASVTLPITVTFHASK